MNGVAALRQLLANDAALTDLVPAVRIVGGILPQGTPVPAISLMSISETERNVPAPGARRRVTERVEARVLAADWASLRAIDKALKNAGCSRMPAVAGIESVTVHLAGAGPEGLDVLTQACARTRDFRVSYTEAR